MEEETDPEAPLWSSPPAQEWPVEHQDDAIWPAVFTVLSCPAHWDKYRAFSNAIDPAPAKAGMIWSKVKCSRFQSASQTQGACPQLPDCDPSPEWPWTADRYTPLSNDKTEPRASTPRWELSRPSAGVHRMGMLKGSFVCFQKPLWLIFWHFPPPFPFPPDLHLPRSSSTYEREVGSSDCKGLRSTTISSHS